MSYEVEGKIHKVFDTVVKGDFSSREFILEVGSEYPQFIKFQLVRDKCDHIDPFNEGQQAKIFFDLRGREWNEKYFTTLQAWKVQLS